MKNNKFVECKDNVYIFIYLRRLKSIINNHCLSLFVSGKSDGLAMAKGDVGDALIIGV